MLGLSILRNLPAINPKSTVIYKGKILDSNIKNIIFVACY
ncbi:hypothetical protein ECHHL_0178 [Ehrlichia chaffeensis str. Heartland]|nr:hypothetical protein ECHHL_0178 [Ehrlichia chaffeensis str. Heartland]AHX05933.1 hypothetical protein ECHJAX_0881 [Ehrlichia chaffeensis str. Jax]AHX06923.1 hypothetical protein ECHLIB_0884 [Ehrlichia chaffeensis str. Liberty]AHX07667.1 hypothetical protein ECHOSC_0184 [Ehrlichia chaffeensis str. Osceola]AHX08836.1 hypothetical protein ECHSTV_0870 [Ehrlichia chaffeensis str. Saint Vincent]AHX09650.1 hypothetical protein ECHWAK_0880 [Ehrlichia chaffeensis str. Wakulla]AHX10737.1 hypothetica